VDPRFLLLFGNRVQKTGSTTITVDGWIELRAESARTSALLRGLRDKLAIELDARLVDPSASISPTFASLSRILASFTKPFSS